jgi:hypothetical protein
MASPSAEFTFGFVVNDETKPHDETVTSDKPSHAHNVHEGIGDLEQNHSLGDSKPSGAVRKPFSFFSSALVQRLLKERASEEIIHDEILVGDVIFRRVDTAQSSFVETPVDDNDDTTIAVCETANTDNGKPKLKLRKHHPSDLIPGVYEGGAAVWEGSLDLLEYLESIREELLAMQMQYDKINDDTSSQHKQPFSVLELGCGHALPALYLMHILQPQLFVLTDYNDDVLKDVTISNLVINFATQLDSIAERVVLGSGDWLEMSKTLLRLAAGEKLSDDHQQQQQASITEPLGSDPHHLPANGLFSIILAAETLYTPQAAQETAYFVAHHLALDGFAYISTKRYYFGVGGGADCFRECAITLGLFVESVHVVNTGRGNVREVLRVTRQSFRNWF